MDLRWWGTRAASAAAMAVALLAVAPAGTAHAETAPVLVDGALTPGDDSAVRAIDDRGDVVGDWYAGRCCRQPPHGFVRTADGTFVRLDDPTGEYPSSEAVALNRSGTVAGSLISPRRVGLWPSIPFTWTAGGGLTRLPAPEGETAARAVAVSSAGRVLVNGVATGGAYLYEPRGGRYVRLPDAGEGAAAAAMNDRGDVVGAVTVGGHRHAAVWVSGRRLTDLHRETLGADTEATDVNARGEIIGTGTAPSDAGTVTRSLYWPSARAAAEVVEGVEFAGLNDHGCIVGSRAEGSGARTVVWQSRRGRLEERAVDVPPLTGDPYGGFLATAINNRGLLGGVLGQTTPDKLVNHAAIVEGGC
jgi:hypothetical protein